MKPSPSPVFEHAQAQCLVRTRMPASHQDIAEFDLFLYQEKSFFFDDNRATLSGSTGTLQHFALVFGSYRQIVHSKSLNRLLTSNSSTSGTATIEDRCIDLFSRGQPLHDGPVDDAQLIDSPLLMRIHSSCFTGETMFSARCDCAYQLEHAMQQLSGNKDGGIVVYLSQEGRGIGIEEKLRAYNLQDSLGLDTVCANLALDLPVDARRYELAAAILRDLLPVSHDEIISVSLLTNNPDKIQQLEKCGIDVVIQVPIIHEKLMQRKHDSDGEVLVSSELETYLKTKADKMNHIIPPFCPTGK